MGCVILLWSLGCSGLIGIGQRALDLFGGAVLFRGMMDTYLV